MVATVSRINSEPARIIELKIYLSMGLCVNILRYSIYTHIPRKLFACFVFISIYSCCNYCFIFIPIECAAVVFVDLFKCSLALSADATCQNMKIKIPESSEFMSIFKVCATHSYSMGHSSLDCNACCFTCLLQQMHLQDISDSETDFHVVNNHVYYMYIPYRGQWRRQTVVLTAA